MMRTLPEGHVEQRRDLGAHQERVLAGRPHGDSVRIPLRDDAVRLHRVLVDAREGVVPLDHDRRVRERRVHTAPVDAIPVADVAVPLRQRAQAVEQPGPQRTVLDQRRARRERILERAHDRQLLVIDHDLPEGGLGGGLVHGRDRCHRLAREPDPVDGHDGPVLDGVAPVGVDVQDVRTREHRDDARHRKRACDVYGHDPGMSHRAPEHLAVQHPGHAHVTDVAGIATQLVVRVHAAHRATYLGSRNGRTAGRLDGHDGDTPASSPAASTMAR